jgi:hypothetical protein
MALPVQFRWLDIHGRVKRQTLTSTATTLAAALTDVTAFVALFDAVSDGGLQSVSISQTDDSDAFVAAAGSNIDVNGSLLVQGDDGFKYDLNLPMILASLVTGGGAIDIGDAALVSFTNQFLTGGAWRVNNRFPTFITSVISGQLDK